MEPGYQLSASDHERVYKDEIEPAYFLVTTPVGSPSLIIVGGPPGAGKSKVLSASKSEFTDLNLIVVNTDDLREYHPRFEEFAELDDKRAAERTHEDASLWNHELLCRSIQTRRNIILEGVFKDSTKLLKLASEARSQGYAVLFRVIAAHRRFSLFGIHARYEQEKKAKKYGRFVPVDYHEECYNRFPSAIKAVEDQQLLIESRCFLEMVHCFMKTR